MTEFSSLDLHICNLLREMKEELSFPQALPSWNEKWTVCLCSLNKPIDCTFSLQWYRWSSPELLVAPSSYFIKMTEKIGILVAALRGFSSTPAKLEIKIETPENEFPDKNFF